MYSFPIIIFPLFSYYLLILNMKHYNGLHTKNTDKLTIFYEIKDYGIKVIGKGLGENITNCVYGYINIKNKKN